MVDEPACKLRQIKHVNRSCDFAVGLLQVNPQAGILIRQDVVSTVAVHIEYFLRREIGTRVAHRISEQQRLLQGAVGIRHFHFEPVVDSIHLNAPHEHEITCSDMGHEFVAVDAERTVVIELAVIHKVLSRRCRSPHCVPMDADGSSRSGLN